MDTFPKGAGRRKLLAIFAGIASAIVIGDRALASKKPASKKNVKKPTKKAPAKKAPAKPMPKSSSAPQASTAPTPGPTPGPTPAASPTATTSETSSAALPDGAKALTVAGKNLTIVDLAVGATTVATFPKNGVNTPVLVTRIDEKNFVALRSVCTHAGGPVEIFAGSLLCRWHNSRFNQRTGEVTSGPAESPLPKENVTLIGNTLYYLP